MHIIFKLFVISFLFSTLSCQTASEKVTSPTLPAKVQQASKKTQVLLLTQPFDVKTALQRKELVEYVTQSDVNIPNDVASLGSWMMFEGPVLENDRIAYRCYADSRNRFDIYAKSVTDLVMDTVSWNYHDIMDWGTDVLKVGNSLGIGSPAIWYQDSLYTFSTYAQKTIAILENGDNRSTVRTTFTDLVIAGEKIDLQQDWSLAAGVPYTSVQLTITKGNLPSGAHFATGIVKHIKTDQTGEINNQFYAYTWGKQSFHKQYLGMAIFAKKDLVLQKVADDLTHAYVLQNTPSNTVEYAFLAAWERGNSRVTSEAEFKRYLKQYVK
ncbi:MAG: DUF4861 family protein [Bacteroidota bacterium]